METKLNPSEIQNVKKSDRFSRFRIVDLVVWCSAQMGSTTFNRWKMCTDSARNYCTNEIFFKKTVTYVYN